MSNTYTIGDLHMEIAFYGTVTKHEMLGSANYMEVDLHKGNMKHVSGVIAALAKKFPDYKIVSASSINKVFKIKLKK